jgi:Anti-sigma factor NepR
VPESDSNNRMRAVPNSLTFSQSQVTFILGHSLKHIYQDVLQAPIPDDLRALVGRLERRDRFRSGSEVVEPQVRPTMSLPDVHPANRGGRGA